MQPYKPTGNLAVDMVAACINHAEYHKKKVRVIYLKRKLWRSFTDHVKQTMPDYLFTDEVDFDGTLVRQSSLFQTRSMHYELEKPTLQAV